MNIEKDGLKGKKFNMYNRIKQKIFSLKTELVVIIASVCLLVFVAASFGSYNAIFSILSKRTEIQTVQQLRQVEYNINKLFDDIKEVHNILLSNPDVQEFKEKDDQNSIESVYVDIDLISSVNTILNYYSFINSIDIFTDRGEVFYLSKKYNSKEIVNSEKTSFLNSALYKQAIDSFPNIVWKAGSIKSISPEYNVDTGNPDMKMITALKCTKSRYGNQNTVTAINVEEKYLSELYNKLTDENNTLRVYILVGNEDLIPGDLSISSSKYNRIIDELKTNPNKTYGQLTYTDSQDNQQTNIIYYRIKNMDWTLVREIPIVEVSEDVILLRRIIIVTFVASFCIIILMVFFWISKVLKPIYELSKAMKDVGNGNLGHTLKKVSRNEIGLLIKQFNTMSVNIFNLLEDNRQIENEKRIQEIKALQAQINPHFLYNTLNAIKYMAIVSEAQNVANSITILGNIIRPIFREKSIMYTLREEIEFLKNYIELLNLRFGDNILLKYEISEEYLNCSIPRFILQPIIENCIIHGIQDSDCAGNINIEVIGEHDCTNIIISDNGKGMNAEKVKELNDCLMMSVKQGNDSETIGIGNVNRRIQLHFGKQYGLSIESRQSKGTRVLVKIPPVFKEN
jgi:two-component system, sensor histidine kinase YesM